MWSTGHHLRVLEGGSVCCMWVSCATGVKTRRRGVDLSEFQSIRLLVFFVRSGNAARHTSQGSEAGVQEFLLFM